MHPSVCTVLVSTLSIDTDGWNNYVGGRIAMDAQAHYNIWTGTRIPSVSQYGEVITGIYGVIAAILLNIETMQVEQLQ